MLSFVGAAIVQNDKKLSAGASVKAGVDFPCTVEYFPAVHALSVFKGHKIPSRFARGAKGPDGTASVVDGSPAVRKARQQALVTQLHSSDVVNIRAETEGEACRAGESRAAAVVSSSAPLAATSPAQDEPDDSRSTGNDDVLRSLTIAYRPRGSKSTQLATFRFIADNSTVASKAHAVAMSMTLPGVDPTSPAVAPAASGRGEDDDAPPGTACANQAPTFTLPGVQLRKIGESLRRKVFPFGPLHLTALVSPASGKGQGLQLWQSHAQPIIDASPHTAKIIMTTHRGFAEEYADTASLRPNEVIVAVGGDGMYHEVINGYMRRVKREEKAAAASSVAAADADAAEGTTPTMPRIAMFPTGSGCALAKTLGVLDLVEAALAMVQAQSLPIDLVDMVFSPITRLAKGKKKTDPRTEMAAETIAHHERYSFLSVTCAFGADVDIKSEAYRWMGNARFTVYALKEIVAAVPSYPIKMRYKPAKVRDVAPGHRAAGASLDHPLDNTAAVKSLTTPFSLYADVRASMVDGGSPQQHRDNDEDRRAAAAGGGGEHQAEVDDWVVVPQEEFTFLMVCNIPWVARDMIAAPFAHVNDHTIDVIYAAPGVTRKELVSALIDIETGKHVDHARIRYVKAREVEVTPRDGLVSVDGENMPLSVVHAKCSDSTLPIVHAPFKPSGDDFEKAVLAAASQPPL